MNNLIKSIIIFGALLPFYSKAQFRENKSFIGPGATAGSAIRHSSTPVDLYTGVPYIGLDLFALKSRNGMDVPISLSYHAGGHKVQDVASNIGLGWSISANSMITRVVKGLPDEQANGYFGSNMGQKIYGVLSHDDLKGIIDLELDSEPDLFFYNLNGIHGKFVFDYGKNPVMLPDNGMRILNSPFKQEMGINGWVMADLYGNRYYLGTDAATRESCTAVIKNETDSKSLGYASSWYLGRILTANDADTILYEYSSGEQTDYQYYNAMHVYRQKIVAKTRNGVHILGFPIIPRKVTSHVSVVDDRYWANFTHIYTPNTKYLSAISTAHHKALFHYDMDNGRMDLRNGRAMTQVEVRTKDDQPIKRFLLHQSYFVSDGTPESALLSSFDNEPNGNAQYDRYRLRLDSVSEEYGPADRPLIAVMRYSDLRLPPRSSKQLDHWGYYNSSTGNEFVEGQDVFSFHNIDDYRDESKSVSHTRMQANMLREIRYQGGAFKRFHYEGNSWGRNGTTEPIGGLRIHRIEDEAGEGTAPLVTQYAYLRDGRSSGQPNSLTPQYRSSISHSLMHFFQPNIPWFNSDHQFPAYSQPVLVYTSLPYLQPAPLNSNWQSAASSIYSMIVNYSRTSEIYSPFELFSYISLNDLFDVNGNTVGYSEVSVSRSGRGREVTRFLDIDDHPDYSTQMMVNSGFQPTSRTPPSMSPYTPNTSYAFARGMPKEVLSYDNAGRLLSRQTFEYAFGNGADSVLAFKCALGHVEDRGVNGIVYSSNYYNVGYYSYVSKPFQLVRAVQEDFASDNGGTLGTEAAYTYHPQYPGLLTGVITTYGDSTHTGERMYYVADRDSVAYDEPQETLAAATLYNRGMYGVLLEKRHSRNDGFMHAAKTGYGTFARGGKQLLLPRNTYQLKPGQHRLVKQVLSYDAYGNALEINEGKHNKRSYGWSDDGLQLRYTALNAGLDELFLEDFEHQSGNNIANGGAFSGNRYHLGSYTLDFVKPGNGREYRYSYWYLEDGQWHYSGLLPYLGAGTALQGDGVDLVCVVPADAALTTTVQTDLGLPRSRSDAGGFTERFEYDSRHRLLHTRNGDRELVRTHRYNDKPPTVLPNQPVYVNARSRQLYRKSGCPIGYYGQKMEYVVPYDSYEGSSQQQADSLALADIMQNGQEFADQHGQCRPYGVFAQLCYANRTTEQLGDRLYTYQDLFVRFFKDEYAEITLQVDSLQVFYGQLHLGDLTVAEADTESWDLTASGVAVMLRERVLLSEQSLPNLPYVAVFPDRYIGYRLLRHEGYQILHTVSVPQYEVPYLITDFITGPVHTDLRVKQAGEYLYNATGLCDTTVQSSTLALYYSPINETYYADSANLVLAPDGYYRLLAAEEDEGPWPEPDLPGPPYPTPIPTPPPTGGGGIGNPVNPTPYPGGQPPIGGGDVVTSEEYRLPYMEMTNGRIIRTGFCDWLTYTPLLYGTLYYATSADDICAPLTSQEHAALYRNSANGKYYVDAGLQVLPPDGYYMGWSGSYYRLLNGGVMEIGSCPGTFF